MNQPSGQVVIYTGDGKGKTTAALGTALRALGGGLRVSIVQFLKREETGEHRALARLGAGGIEILRLGTGFVREDPPPEEAVAAARHALAVARERLTGGRCDMVILDEVFPAVSAKLLAEEDVLALMDVRPEGVHLVMTGRGAPASALERADLVTEMRCVAHPFDRGAAGVPGLDR